MIKLKSLLIISGYLFFHLTHNAAAIEPDLETNIIINEKKRRRQEGAMQKNKILPPSKSAKIKEELDISGLFVLLDAIYKKEEDTKNGLAILSAPFQGYIGKDGETDVKSEKVWHGTGKRPGPKLIKKALELQRFFLEHYNFEIGELTDSPKNIREKAKKKLMERFGGKDHFRVVYSAAYHYGTDEECKLYRKFAINQSTGSKMSTFRIDKSLWQSANLIPRPGIIEKALELQRFFLKYYNIETGKLTDSLENIHKKAKEEFLDKCGSNGNYSKVCSAAYYYGTLEECEIYRMFKRHH